MKITGFRTLVLGTPWRNLTYLVLETDEGLEGSPSLQSLIRTNVFL